MVQRLLPYLTEHVHPLIGRTLNHTKLKSENFLQGIHFYIIQDEEQLLLNSDQGQLWSPSAILTLTIWTY